MALRPPTHWRRLAVATLLVVGVALLLFDFARWWRSRPRADGGSYRARDGGLAPSGSGLRYSGYVYRDRNRSGRLDVGDLPMTWVALEMTRPDGKRSIARSNLTGFANFALSRRQRHALIRRPGEYKFRLLVPPGWELTSRNAEQTSHVEELAGAPADLVSRDPIKPFGLAPKLSLAGRCLRRRADGSLGAAPGARVEVEGPGGRRAAVTVAADGTFTIAAVPGRWRLAVRAAASPFPLVRVVEVRDAPVHVGGLVLGQELPAPTSGRAQVVDFDSVTGVYTAKIPSGVAGLDWDYMNVIDAVWPDHAPGYVNTLASGRYVGYNSSGFVATISRRERFDFHGAYFGAALEQAHGEQLHVRAYRDGVLVADDELVLSVLGPVWLAADYRDVDRVVLATERYWQFAVDELTVSLRGASATTGAPSALATGAAIGGSPSARATAPPSQ